LKVTRRFGGICQLYIPGPRRRLVVSSKNLLTFNGIQCIKSQKIKPFITTAVRISGLGLTTSPREAIYFKKHNDGCRKDNSETSKDRLLKSQIEKALRDRELFTVTENEDLKKNKNNGDEQKYVIKTTKVLRGL
jgi:hypothetical protein